MTKLWDSSLLLLLMTMKGFRYIILRSKYQIFSYAYLLLWFDLGSCCWGNFRSRSPSKLCSLCVLFLILGGPLCPGWMCHNFAIHPNHGKARHGDDIYTNWTRRGVDRVKPWSQVWIDFISWNYFARYKIIPWNSEIVNKLWTPYFFHHVI